MRKLLKNKRGNWIDIFEYLGNALGIGILALIVGSFLVLFNTGLNDSAAVNPILNDSVALAKSQEATNKFPKAMDMVLPLIYIFTVGFVVWSARNIPNSHMFTFIGIIVLIILTLFSLVIESGWEEFRAPADFSTTLANIPVTDFMLQYLRYFVLFAGLLTGWALYAKET